MGSCRVLCQIFDPAEFEHEISNASNILQSSNAKFRTQGTSDCARFDKLIKIPFWQFLARNGSETPRYRWPCGATAGLSACVVVR